MEVIKSGNTFQVFFNYDPDMVSLIKSIKPRGIFRKSYESHQKSYWEFPLNSLEILLDTLIPYGFSIDESVLEYIQKLQRDIEKKETEKNLRWEWCLKNLEFKIENVWMFKPFQHQLEAVKFLVENKKVILAHDMGLGKTKSALMASSILQDYYKNQGVDLKIIVICPASLKINWVREAETVRVKIEVWSYGKPPVLSDFPYILICDEAHFIQNKAAQRTKKILSLAENRACFFLFALTGTPIKNGRPSNIFPILKAIDHPIARDEKLFELRYCDAKKTAFTAWDITGSANLEELNIKISDKLLRRTKNECLDLPPKIFTNIEYADSEAEKEYLISLTELKIDYHERLCRKQISNGGQALVFLGFLRRLSSIYKVNQTIQMTEDLISQGQSVVIFSEYKDTVQKIADYFGVDAFTGECDLIKRQKIMDDFQNQKTQIFVATRQTGGTGITLTKSNNLIMHDFPLTPGDYDQAISRIDRIGQTGTCNIYNIFGKDIDFIIAALLKQKSEKIDKVLKKNKIQIENSNSSDFYEKLLEKLLS
jgi:SNF2 family DNA or RNA helicase